MFKLSKELLGLTGEYAVATELCKKGIYAQLTLGHHKCTDILLETEHNMFRIQVKAKQGGVWPAVKGIYRDDDFLVLVDLAGKKGDDRPDFYILNVKDWKKLLDREKQLINEAQIDDKLRITFPDGWKGLNIKPNIVNGCKEAWDKILNRVK